MTQETAQPQQPIQPQYYFEELWFFKNHVFQKLLFKNRFKELWSFYFKRDFEPHGLKTIC